SRGHSDNGPSGVGRVAKLCHVTTLLGKILCPKTCALEKTRALICISPAIYWAHPTDGASWHAYHCPKKRFVLKGFA
ncbi:MAG TPA: hypothetical protein PKI05_16915, partial [Thermogutta sp.]|nr:hypothetical protein [Thermogutta sp.]